MRIIGESLRSLISSSLAILIILIPLSVNAEAPHLEEETLTETSTQINLDSNAGSTDILATSQMTLGISGEGQRANLGVSIPLPENSLFAGAATL